MFAVSKVKTTFFGTAGFSIQTDLTWMESHGLRTVSRDSFFTDKDSPLRGESLSVKKAPIGYAYEGLLFWWAVRGLNPRHPACKADALPTELTALAERIQTVPRETRCCSQRGFPYTRIEAVWQAGQLLELSLWGK